MGVVTLLDGSLRDIRGGGGDTSLAWSPDGSRLAIMRQVVQDGVVVGGQPVWLDAVDSQTEVPLGVPELDPYLPIWLSPDGTWFAALGTHVGPGTGRDVLLISATGSGRLVALPEQPGFDFTEATWAPAG